MKESESGHNDPISAEGFVVRRSTLLISWWILCLALAGCNDSAPAASGPNAAGRGATAPPPRVVVAPVELRNLVTTIEALGTSLANESVTITAKLTDTISQVRFDDGQLVEAGDVLVELTNREQTALLAEAEANVEDARLQWQRLADLLQQRSVPVSQVDEAKARLTAAQARFDSILARLADRLIRAPFSGLLGFRQVSEGTLVTPVTPITTLDDIATIKLDFTVPETLIASLRPGLVVAASAAAWPGRVFRGEIRTIGSRVDPVTRAITARALVANDDLLLRPGMLLTVQLETNPRQALTLSDSAIIQDGATSFVFVMDNEQVQRREIRTGQRSNNLVEILDGLTVGDSVVVEGQIKLRDGMTVRTGSDRDPAPVAVGA